MTPAPENAGEPSAGGLLATYEHGAFRTVLGSLAGAWSTRATTKPTLPNCG
jgi:hypothetical protein